MFKVSKPKEQSNVSRTIRFTEELSEQLLRIANQENVSVNTLVLQCCQYAIENYEKNIQKREK